MRRVNLLSTLGLLCVLAVIMAAASPGQAAVVLRDRNSEVVIDPNSDSGMYSWKLNGVENLYRQWFYYRIGGSGGESAINKLNLTQVMSLDLNDDEEDDQLLVRYADPNGRFTVSVVYTLTGADLGEKSSHILEQITIKNTSGAILNLNFFQYSDFNLNGDANDDSVSITGGNKASQTDPGGLIAETIATSAPTYVEASLVPNLLGSLNDGSTTTLSGSTSAGPGDVAWGFQWVDSMVAGETIIISKNKIIVPEPGTLVLLGLGVAGLLVRGRRGRA